MRRADREANTRAYAASVLKEAREELSRADSKAAILFAGLGVASSVVIAPVLSGSWTPSAMLALPATLWWAGVALLTLSLASFTAVLYPRTVYPKKRITSLSYFGDAIGRSPEELTHALMRSSENTLVPIVEQIIAIAHIVDIKYRHTRRGLQLFALSIGFLVASALTNGA